MKHTHQRRWRQIVMVMTGLLLSLLIQPAHAQTPSDYPAYIALQGDLYTWTPGDTAVRPFTGCDLDGNKILTLALSPTGTHLALNVVSPEIFAGGYAPSPTGNIWLCDLQNESVQTITTINVISESVSQTAVWSPDGTRLAWAKPNYDTPSASIYTYDLASQTISTLVADTPLDYACGVGPFPPVMSWSDTGIAVGYFIGGAEDPCLSESIGIYVYDTDEQRIADLKAGISGESTGLDQMMWNTEQGDSLIFSQLGYTGWQTVKLDSGIASPAQGIPQEFVATAGANSPTITWVKDDNGTTVPAVVLPGLSAEQTIQPSRSVQGFNIGFSPDGRAAVFQVEENLYGVIEGDIRLLDLGAVGRMLSDTGAYYQGSGIAWAALGMRITREAAQAACPNIARVYYPNDTARVIEGIGANNIRSLPLRDAEALGEIPEGDSAEVVMWDDVCSGGIRWRYVRYQGISGWTAEAQDSTAYLEPDSSSG